jgi:hypothetical protein
LTLRKKTNDQYCFLEENSDMQKHSWYKEMKPTTGLHSIMQTGVNRPSLIFSVDEDVRQRWDKPGTLYHYLYSMSEQLVAYLNDRAPRPAWLDQYTRIDEVTLVHVDFGTLRAFGPVITTNRITQRESYEPEHVDARARLIDQLTLLVNKSL